MYWAFFYSDAFGFRFFTFQGLHQSRSYPCHLPQMFQLLNPSFIRYAHLRNGSRFLYHSFAWKLTKLRCDNNQSRSESVAVRFTLSLPFDSVSQRYIAYKQNGFDVRVFMTGLDLLRANRNPSDELETIIISISCENGLIESHGREKSTTILRAIPLQGMDQLKFRNIKFCSSTRTPNANKCPSRLHLKVYAQFKNCMGVKYTVLLPTLNSSSSPIEIRSLSPRYWEDGFGRKRLSRKIS